MVIRKYAVPAYWPRSDARSVQYANAALDIVYEVHDFNGASAASKNHTRGDPSGGPNGGPSGGGLSSGAQSGRPHSEGPHGGTTAENGNQIGGTAKSGNFQAQSQRMNISFLHGGQYSKESFRYMIESCEREFGADLRCCISPDHAVCGDSAVLNEGKAASFLVWEDMARDAACVVRDCLRRGLIDISEPLIVFGHSMGGAASIALSVFEPALVAALVLIDPTWGGDVAVADAGLFSLATAKLARAAYRNAVVDFKDIDEYREYMNTRYSTHAAHPRVRDAMTASSFQTANHGEGAPRAVSMKVSKASQAGPYYSAQSILGLGKSLAHRIRAPTLIVHGDIYDFNPEGSTEALESHIRESGNSRVQRKLIPGTAHMVCHTHPDETFAATKDFMRESAKQFYAQREEEAKQYALSVDERFHQQLAASLAAKS